eukprot:7921863-Lingulodinium_polyedra.AAC.1
MAGRAERAAGGDPARDGPARGDPGGGAPGRVARSSTTTVAAVRHGDGIPDDAGCARRGGCLGAARRTSAGGCHPAIVAP